MLVVACTLSAAGGAAAEPPSGLLLITIDTLRADYLSCNGSQRVATPHLDRLAREGVNFTRARSPVPLTLPAHASIFTGNYPPTHGVRDNGTYRLAEEQLSLAEVLQQAGFRTGAFVSSFVLDRRFGLAQGFDEYDDRVWDRVEELERTESERPAGEVLASLRRWLETIRREDKFFAWVHLYDPHAPYSPPEPHRSRYPGDPYAGEVAYVDQVVGEMLALLAASNRLDSTLLAVVGDHGESLGEHGEATHSLLIYNSALHVPMILRAPGLIPAETTVPQLVSVIDLAPTLLDYLERRRDLGRSSGSLRSLIERSAGSESVVVAATPPVYSESLFPLLNLGWSALEGVETDSYRLIVAPEPELYDLTTDPGETVDLFQRQQETARRLRGDLARLTATFDAGEQRQAPSGLDREAQKRLRSLGYLGGSGSESVTRSDGPLVDPKSKISTWNQIQLAVFQLGESEDRSAAATLEKILQQDPGIPIVYEFLGSSWMRLGEWSRAEAVFRQALDQGVETGKVHLKLGEIHLQRREYAAAERELEIALAMEPDSVPGHFWMGNVLRAIGRAGEAADHYRRALEVNPSYIWAWNGLGLTLAGQRRNLEALAAFRRVVEIEPEGAGGYFNLALQLERLGERREAVVAYRRFLELAGEEGFAEERTMAETAIRRLSAGG